MRFAKMLGLEVSASPLRKNQAAALTSMEARRPQFRTIQQRGTGVVNQFLPQQVQTGQELLNYYKGGPDEAGMNADNATALRTLDNGYAAAGARLRAMGARTGADTTGAATTLETNRVAAAFPIQQSIATRRAAEKERFKRGAVTTAGQISDVGRSIEMQGLQGGQSLDGQIMGAAGSLAQADEARRQATLQRIVNFAQQAGQIAGGAPSGGGGRAVAAPQPAYFDPYGQPGGDGYNYSYYPGGW